MNEFFGRFMSYIYSADYKDATQFPFGITPKIKVYGGKCRFVEYY